MLDAGVLISVDRGDDAARSFLTAAHRTDTPLHTTHPVVAQVWRSGARQARLTRFLRSLTVHPLDDGPRVGRLLAASRTTDVVDAHLVAVAVSLDDAILTGDSDDLTAVADALGDRQPTIHSWP